jgi:hypothetical protein
MSLRPCFKTLVLLAATFTAACSDDKPGGTGGSGGSGAAVYAIATTLNANTAQASSLIFTSSSLADGPALNESQGISIPDVVTIFGIEGSGKVYSTAAMSAIVTEYDVDTSGAVRPGTQLSFASFGLTGGFSTRAIAIVSPTKAYLLDDTTLQAITFNPQTMTVGSAISLAGMRETGYGASFSYSIPVRNQNQVVVTAYYYDQTFSHTVPKTAVALIDATTDAVTIVKDTRCGDFSSIAAAPNGDLYFASDPYATALNRIGGDSVAPQGCMLRMKSGENAFDASFSVQLRDITTMSGGGVVPGSGNTVWVRGYDESVTPITGTTTAVGMLGSPAWKWFKVDLANPTAMATVSSFAPSAGQLNFSIVAGHAYVVNGSADLTSTTLVDMSTAGAPVRAANMLGRTKAVVKVR